MAKHIQVKSREYQQITITKIFTKVIVVAQVFGYFPLSGVLEADPTKLRFSYKTPIAIYSILTLLGASFMLAMQLTKTIAIELTIFQAESLTYYAGSAYVGITFIDLAKKWPKLMADWEAIEKHMKNYGPPKGLNKKITILMVLFLSAAADTFFFNYIDVFIMIVSICLSSRMAQVTEAIRSASDCHVREERVWAYLREDYTRLGQLCRTVNKIISNAILVSFLPNVLIILIQVFNSIKPLHNYLEAIYFYFSLVFLISRTVAVSIYGAMVSEEGRRPLNILNCVSSDVYNNEIEIFINQISNFEILLTGKNFFSIRRHIILEIAAALVTYELVLIQFNQEYLNSYSKSNRCV
ncbi:LOW QUALITY PROTEIN: gustatory receptor for sugar taste 64a-like [Cylas formicarius]|uniref:LOW QUALITY PROTEIN: gustatory receptor for sugar taste 64a-like n=1 Tax=Cylas formicarius TaxID=197179 RepID=UPI0029584781|nr:LOW QUALITY PROTEIN: gustatory receptor for sugar taste 64a-like [Cylas formicarius]